MVSTTYEEYRVDPLKCSPDRRRQRRRGFFLRLMDSIAESQQRAAIREIAKHADLLSPAWFEQMNEGASSCVRRE
jgi:hypothetical protein